MGKEALSSARTGMDPKVKDALDHVRVSAQELHGAMSDAVAKRAGATKADLEAFAQKAKAVTESAKSSMSAQNEAAKSSGAFFFERTGNEEPEKMTAPRKLR